MGRPPGHSGWRRSPLKPTVRPPGLSVALLAETVDTVEKVAAATQTPRCSGTVSGCRTRWGRLRQRGRVAGRRPLPGVHARLLAQKAPRAPPTEARYGEVGQVDTNTPRRPRRGEVRESDARSQTRRAIDYATIRGEAVVTFFVANLSSNVTRVAFSGDRRSTQSSNFRIIRKSIGAGTALVTEKVRRAPNRLLFCTTVP